MGHSAYDLTPEDMNDLRAQVAKLVEVNGLWTNPVDIVLLGMYQLRIMKWIKANTNPDGTRKKKTDRKPEKKGLFD